MTIQERFEDMGITYMTWGPGRKLLYTLICGLAGLVVGTIQLYIGSKKDEEWFS